MKCVIIITVCYCCVWQPRPYSTCKIEMT